MEIVLILAALAFLASSRKAPTTIASAPDTTTFDSVIYTPKTTKPTQVEPIATQREAAPTAGVSPSAPGIMPPYVYSGGTPLTSNAFEDFEPSPVV